MDWETFILKLQPGEHIASERKHNRYEHHGIYMGNGMVIHLQGPIKSKESNRYSECKTCGYVPAEKGGRVETCLECFRLGRSCYIIRYRSPSQVDDLAWDSLVPGSAIYGYNSKKIYLELYLDKKMHGHIRISTRDALKYKVKIDNQIKLSELTSTKSPEEVIETAKHYCFKKYLLLLNNCEDFAVQCKTDKAKSIQVEKKLQRIAPFGIGKLVYQAAKCAYRLINGKCSKFMKLHSNKDIMYVTLVSPLKKIDGGKEIRIKVREKLEKYSSVKDVVGML